MPERVNGWYPVPRHQIDDYFAMSGGEDIRYRNEATTGLGRERSDGGFDTGVIVSRHCCDLHRKGGGSGLDRPQEIRSPTRTGLWVKYYPDSCNVRRDLL